MELIPIKERMPDKNGKYLVLIQKPIPNCTYVGPMPWDIIFEVAQYIIEPRALVENEKVPYWAYGFGEKDYTFFITHWSELPELPKNYKDHRPDKKEAVDEYYKIQRGVQAFYGK